MTTPKLEAIARALRANDYQLGVDDLDDGDLQRLARAVLTELLEPDVPMLVAGGIAGRVRAEVADVIWQAMIQSILEGE